MAKDVRDYIAGYLVCAKHSTAVRSQILSKVSVSAPMELLGIDFVGLFPKFPGVEVFFILVVIDYFSRYIRTRATKSENSDAVVCVLEEVFTEHGVPVGIYADLGSYFGKATQKFAESFGVVWCTSPVAGKKATGIVEKAVDVLQRALKKRARDPSRWPTALQKSTFDINRKDMMHLGYSPHEILKGFVPDGPLEAKFPPHRRESLKSSLVYDTSKFLPENDEIHGDMVIDFIIKRDEVRRKALVRSDDNRERTKERDDLGVRAQHTYTPAQLVMLWDAKTAGKRLRAAWRGPFVVTEFGGDVSKSYTIRQFDGSPIPRHYYGDHLKPFRLREGYLVTHEKERIPVYQNIRLGNAAFKLPKAVKEIQGSHNM
ncbi:hypothetical protein K3495_g5856 [Podosphaera aphanis]|nr:hypothetical protein K3495_g5856 [Podosphaera aphanis]